MYGLPPKNGATVAAGLVNSHGVYVDIEEIPHYHRRYLLW